MGYILYNDQVALRRIGADQRHQRPADAKGITDLVLDLRYDGGGLLDLASELGYMIGGNQTAGRPSSSEQFNNQYPRPIR